LVEVCTGNIKCYEKLCQNISDLTRKKRKLILLPLQYNDFI
jgi:hypothetical protein